MITISDTVAANRQYAGHYVDLDAAVDSGPYYPIVSFAGDDRIIVQTTDDLGAAELSGNDLIGVHTFETLDVDGGVTADFGEDRVIVHDITGSRWSSDSSIIAGSGSTLPLQQ